MIADRSISSSLSRAQHSMLWTDDELNKKSIHYIKVTTVLGTRACMVKVRLLFLFNLRMWWSGQ